MYICLHVKYPFFLSDFDETSFSRRILEKYLCTTFHRNTSSGTQVVPCGQSERERERARRADGNTDVTKLLVAFLNFTNAHKK